jgi:tetratricopeptide (TPR) repeat protein
MMRKKPLILGLLTGAALGAAILGAARRASTTQPLAPKPPLATLNISPADRQMHRAEAAIMAAPHRPDGYNLLAAAFIQKARETGDAGFYARAGAALDRSTQIAPDNFMAASLRATLLVAAHRFSEALQAARRAQSLNPESPDVYGAMTDALVELGDYTAAVQAAQKMMDLRPDLASYARVSYLRQLHGDTEGAVLAMRVAVDAADRRDPERAAWCLVQLGQQLMTLGRAGEAEQAFDAALDLFPNYYMALSAKAHARAAAGDFTSAIDLYKRSLARVPAPDTAIALGDLYTRLGQTNEAKRQYDLVEFIERSGPMAGAYSRQMALFWADHDMRFDEAVEIMRRARHERADIYTCDALAWCLFKKGEIEQARQAITEAMRLQTRDARIFYHAGMIHAARGDRQNAAKYLKLALEINPAFDLLQAEVARRTLAQILE